MVSISLSVFQPFELHIFRVPCLGLHPIFYWIFVLLMLSLLSSLYILEISPLSDLGLVKIFSHSVSLYIVLLTVSFAFGNLLSFRRSHLLIVAISVCATGFIIRKWSPMTMYSTVLPPFSSMRFSVAGFMF